MKCAEFWQSSSRHTRNIASNTCHNILSSSIQCTTSEVRQGGSLRPLLFILHINDGFSIESSNKLISYAVDMAILFTGLPVQGLIIRANAFLAPLKIGRTRITQKSMPAKQRLCSFAPVARFLARVNQSECTFMSTLHVVLL